MGPGRLQQAKPQDAQGRTMHGMSCRHVHTSSCPPRAPLLSVSAACLAAASCACNAGASAADKGRCGNDSLVTTGCKSMLSSSTRQQSRTRNCERATPGWAGASNVSSSLHEQLHTSGDCDGSTRARCRGAQSSRALAEAQAEVGIARLVAHQQPLAIAVCSVVCMAWHAAYDACSPCSRVVRSHTMYLRAGQCRLNDTAVAPDQ